MNQMMIVQARGLSQAQFLLDASKNQSLALGTSADCPVRLLTEAGGGALLASFVFNGEGWAIVANEGIAIRTSARQGLASCPVEADQTIELRAKSDDRYLATLSFREYEQPTSDFSLRIYLPTESSATVAIGGAEDCAIRLPDASLRKSAARLAQKNRNWVLIPDGNGNTTLDGCPLKERKTLSDRQFFGVGKYCFYYKEGCLYTSSLEGLKVGTLSHEVELEQTSALRYPVFMRSSRVRPQIGDSEIELLSPKRQEEKQNGNVFLQILPQIGSLAMIVVLRGIIGSGGAYVVYSACTMALGLGVSIISRREDRKRSAAREKDRKERYHAYINQKVEEIIRARQKEALQLNRIFRPLEENLTTVRNFDKGLFDRSPMDDDFMHVRLGVGTLPAHAVVMVSKQEYKETDDELMEIPESVEQKYRDLQNVPIVCDFRTAGAVGIVGNETGCYEMLKNITFDLSVRHYYKELRFYYIFRAEEIEKYSWTRWLRNCTDERTALRNLIYDDESAKIHLEEIYKILAAREESNSQQAEEAATDFPFYLAIFVCDCERVRNHPLSQFFERARELGCVFVFFNEHEELIPRGCSQMIRLDETDNSGRLVLCRDDSQYYDFHYPSVPDSVIREMVMKLCPVHVVEANLESGMTKNITLFELLNVSNAQELNLRRRWAESNIEKSMAVPLGVRSKNDIVYLDLHERYHGPHGLVAGTTGSGKSEILQSYILSMAIHFPPDEVGFLLIDFKGGGMARQFEKLPHLIGTITNIDGREIQRSLKSIRAEITRRQVLFDEASADKDKQRINSIGQYIHLHKTAPERAPVPLPHLIIIADEFAELKSQHPDFMQELISAARIGRSLGIHLILATQKPSGVVDDQIWSNSNFKLCLRVQTREDSKEVIKTPLAAEIREPGRAYLQVGNNEIFELFQSAYSGAALTNTSEEGHEFVLSEVNNWGKKRVVFDNHVRRSDENRTELTAIVEQICEYCDQNGIERLPMVCLKPLAATLNLEEVLEERQRDNHIYATIGMLDDPERHIQCPLHVDITASNLFLLGASQTGKTVQLLTMILSLAYDYTPDDVNVYVIDGGNGMPKSFEKSGIVGGICYREEEERISNLLNMLRREISKRRKCFADANVGTFLAYKEAGLGDMPAILVILDNAASFKEFCESLYEDFLSLTREGNSVGMYFAVSSTQSSVMPVRVMIGFGTRIALNCNDKNEYSNLFDRCQMEPLDVPGRGLIMIDKRILEYQTAWYAQGLTEQSRNKNAEEIIQRLNQGYRGRRAKRIPEVPAQLPAEAFFAECGGQLPPYTVPVGLNYETVEMVPLDLTRSWLLPVVGRSRSGRTNFVRLILDYIQSTTLNNQTECYIVDGPQRQLKYAHRDYGFVREYSIDPMDGAGYLSSIADELESRQDEVVDAPEDLSEEEILKDKPLLLLVVEHPEFLNVTAKEISEDLNRIEKLSRYKVLILIDNVGNASNQQSELGKRLKAGRNGIITDDLSNFHLFDIPFKTINLYKKPIRVGDAYLCFDGNIEQKVHLALSKQTTL